jgi:hypothetical protein
MQNVNENFVRNNMYESKTALYGRPIFYCILTIGLIALGLYQFLEIRTMEAAGEVKLKGISQTVYNFGGKWAVVGSILLAAFILGYRTINLWKGIKKGLQK